MYGGTAVDLNSGSSLGGAGFLVFGLLSARGLATRAVDVFLLLGCPDGNDSFSTVVETLDNTAFY